jgi:hypothetical protein
MQGRMYLIYATSGSNALSVRLALTLRATSLWSCQYFAFWGHPRSALTKRRDGTTWIHGTNANAKAARIGLYEELL